MILFYLTKKNCRNTVYQISSTSYCIHKSRCIVLWILLVLDIDILCIFLYISYGCIPKNWTVFIMQSNCKTIKFILYIYPTSSLLFRPNEMIICKKEEMFLPMHQMRRKRNHRCVLFASFKLYKPSLK